MIAISYRREDSSPVTGRLYDRLRAEFGRRNVFMDFDSIPFGVDFRDKIKHTLERARVVIAVVGPSWAGSRDPGKRRIDDPTDFVRMEIAAALQRGIPVIPVLLDNTVMPSVEDLPEELRPFAYRNALILDTGVDFHHHADRLIAGIHELVDGGPRGKPKGRLLIMGVIVVLALIAAAALWSLIARQNSRPGTTGPVTPAPHATETPVTTPITTTTTTPSQTLPLAATPLSIVTPTPTALPLPSSSPVLSRDLEGGISIPSNFKSIQPSVPQSARTILNRRFQSANGAVQFAVTAINVRGLAPTVEARTIAIPRLRGEEVTERTPSPVGNNHYHEDVTVEGPNHSYTRYFSVDVSTSSSVGAYSRLWEFWVRDEQALQTYKEIYRAFKKSVKFKEE
jgi:hypothetical protein